VNAEDLPRLRQVIKRWAIMYPIQANQLGEQAVVLSRTFGQETDLHTAEDRIGDGWAGSLLAAIEAEFLGEL
jgi:hypothetical protein